MTLKGEDAYAITSKQKVDLQARNVRLMLVLLTCYDFYDGVV